MADQKTTQLTAGTPIGTDILAYVADPSGSPTDKKATLAALWAGAGMVLLETHDASASSALNFTTRNASGLSGASFQSDFDDYEIRLVNLIPATAAAELNLEMSTDGGSSYDTGANYGFQMFLQGVGFTSNNAFGAQSGLSALTVYGDTHTDANRGVIGRVQLCNPLAAIHTSIVYDTFGKNNDGNIYRATGGGVHISTSAVNAFRVKFSAGNITSGSVRLYGLRK